MERSLRSLWELVEMEDRRADERHGEVLQLYTDLQQQQQLVSSQSRGGEDGDRRLRDQQDRLQRKQVLIISYVQLNVSWCSISEPLISGGVITPDAQLRQNHILYEVSEARQ